MKKVFMILIIFLLITINYYPISSSPSYKPFGYLDTTSNRTFVPIRYISEKIQSEVIWNAERQEINILGSNNKITLTVMEPFALVQGVKVELDDAPFIEGGITYVPLRFVVEALGGKINWIKQTQKIVITINSDELKLPIIKKGLLHNRELVDLKKQVVNINNKKVTVNLMFIDLLNSNVKLGVRLAKGKVGNVDELSQIAEEANSEIAINGTFFNAYTESEFKQPYGVLIVDGSLVNRSGENRSIFLYDNNNNVEFINGLSINDRYQNGKISGAIQAGPRLVVDGKVIVDPIAEGFKDPKIIINSGARSAIGFTKDHKLMLLTTSGVTIPELASIMQRLGAVEAMNLDGGASSGLYYNGKYITKPGRLISNALVINLD